LYVRGFLEFGAAILLSFSTPSVVHDNTFLNWTVTLINFILLVVVLPLTYYRILWKDGIPTNIREFKENWGVLLLGAKID